MKLLGNNIEDIIISYSTMSLRVTRHTNHMNGFYLVADNIPEGSEVLPIY